MPVIVIVITGPAANLGRLSIHQGHDRVVRNAAAFDAMVVYDIAESPIIHEKRRQPGVYQESKLRSTGLRPPSFC